MFNTAILLGTLTAIFLAVGWVIGGVFGALVALVFAVIINLFSLFYSDKIVLKMYRAEPSNNRFLKELVEKLSREARIPVPKVYTVPSEVPNAFCVGRNPRHSVVAVTQGLLDNLGEEEIEAVISHEIAHIRNRDMLVQTVAATLGGAIAFIAQFAYYSLFMGGGRSRDNSAIIGIILIAIFAPLAALLIRMAISRRREYKADNTGAVLSKKPLALASALRKISSFTRAHPIRNANSATSHLFIVNPFTRDAFSRLFSTHPPVEKRIEILSHMKFQGHAR